MNTKEINGRASKAYFLGLSGLVRDRKKHIDAEGDTMGFSINVNDAFRYFKDLFGSRLFFDAEKRNGGGYNFQQTRETLENRLNAISESAKHDSLVVLAFSCHGKKDKNGDAVICLNDNDKMTSKELYNLPSFQELVSKDTGLLMLLDSCLSGYASNTMPKNLTLITSTEAKKKAYGSGWAPLINNFMACAKIQSYVEEKDFDSKQIFDLCVKNFEFKIVEDQNYQFYGRNLRIKIANGLAPHKRFGLLYSGRLEEKELRKVKRKHKAEVIGLLKERVETADIQADSSRLATALAGGYNAVVDDWKSEQILAYVRKMNHCKAGNMGDIGDLTMYSNIINQTIHLKENKAYRKLIESLTEPAFDNTFNAPFRKGRDILWLSSAAINYWWLIEAIKPKQKESKSLSERKLKDAQRITELIYEALNNPEETRTIAEINKRLILTLSDLQLVLPMAYGSSQNSSRETIETMFQSGMNDPINELYNLHYKLREKAQNQT